MFMDPSHDIIQDCLFRLAMDSALSSPGKHGVNDSGEEGRQRFVGIDGLVDEHMDDGLPSTHPVWEMGGHMTGSHSSRMSSMARRTDSAR